MATDDKRPEYKAGNVYMFASVECVHPDIDGFKYLYSGRNYENSAANHPIALELFYCTGRNERPYLVDVNPYRVSTPGEERPHQHLVDAKKATTFVRLSTGEEFFVAPLSLYGYDQARVIHRRYRHGDDECGSWYFAAQYLRELEEAARRATRRLEKAILEYPADRPPVLVSDISIHTRAILDSTYPKELLIQFYKWIIEITMMYHWYHLIPPKGHLDENGDYITVDTTNLSAMHIAQIAKLTIEQEGH